LIGGPNILAGLVGVIPAKECHHVMFAGAPLSAPDGSNLAQGRLLGSPSRAGGNALQPTSIAHRSS
jgi:hypothetical protein